MLCYMSNCSKKKCENKKKIVYVCMVFSETGDEKLVSTSNVIEFFIDSRRSLLPSNCIYAQFPQLLPLTLPFKSEKQLNHSDEQSR